MKLRSIGLVGLGASLLIGVAPAPSTLAQEDEAPRYCIGTFDSRALAIAWVRSEAFEESMRDVRAAHAAAEAAGDDDRVEEINAQMQERQKLLHKQGFGIWPVRDILEHLEDELPGIAAAAGVDVIVGQWDVVYQPEGAQLVDVTDEVAAPFEPDEKTRRSMAEIRRHDPVPVEDLDH